MATTNNLMPPSEGEMRARRSAQAQSIVKKAKLKKYLTNREEPAIVAAAPPVRERQSNSKNQDFNKNPNDY